MTDRFRPRADGTWEISAAPSDVVDSGVAWSAKLPEGSSISSSVWTIPVGVTAGAATVAGLDAIQWLGPAVAADYWIENKVTLSTGHVISRGFWLRVLPRLS